MDSKVKVLAYLDKLGLDYQLTEHPPIDTIDALEGFDIPNKHLIAKNLFLRNDNGKQHYLIVIRQDKEVDLKVIRRLMGSSRLSFSSEPRLMKYLGLKKGAVTPLGVVNDLDAHVIVYFDTDLVNEEIIGVHPNDNRATVWMSYNSIIKVLQHNGNVYGVIDVL